MKKEEEVPFLLVGGTDEYRIRRFVRTIVTAKSAAGWTITELEGTDHEGVQRLLSSSGVLFDGQTLVVVTTPEKLPQGLMASHSKDSEPTVVFLLVYDTDKPTGPIADLVPKTCTRFFSLPPFYKLEDYAVKFIREECRSQGITVEDPLAVALTRKVGLDLGVLSFEVDKACQLAKSLGVGALTPEILRDTIAPLSEVDGTALIDAIGSQNLKRVSSEFHRYLLSKGGDPTVELCGRVLSPTILRWLQAAHLHESGVSPTAAAGRMGANPWYWENKVLPPARNWGVLGCKNLLAVVAKSQVAVFNGGVNPWVILESGILRLLDNG